jgi:methylmalonyl-CoA/ethylmalonyl-CoA epimerase
MSADFSLTVHHVGVIVTDLEAAIHAYGSTLGIDFAAFEIDETNSVFSNSSTSFKLRIAFGQASLSAIELIQPVSGETIHASFLRQNGPGIHHLGFWVDDLQAARNRLESRGNRLLSEGEIQDLGSFAYYQSADLHCIVEPLRLAIELPVFLAEHATFYAHEVS